MPKMRAVQVTSAKGPFELVEREIPNPTPGTVRIKVHACGVCHSDVMVKDGLFPGIQYPRIPGHEVAGVIDAVAPDVKFWSVGQKVGVGWFGGNCGHCEPCRRGDFNVCQFGSVSGISYDGGYAEYMIAPTQALALIPDELSFVDAAPLMCAGVTTFNALRNSGVRPGENVAVLGIGGLGHLAVQFAAKLGFNTIAIARGKDKEALAKKLGANHYIDSKEKNVAEALQALGGAKVILATATDSKSIGDTVNGLGINGKLVILGIPNDPIAISALTMISQRSSVAGWPAGTSMDSQDTMKFSARAGVRSMNETFPLEKAEEAYKHMMDGKARFRVVLTT